MKTTFIYALCEPGTRTVRYIGKTQRIKRRLKEHLRESIGHDSHLGHWLSLLASLGEPPEIVILREVEGDGCEAEKRYIRLAKGCQMRLVNSTDGGDGCNNPSPESRKKMGDRQLGEKNHMFGKHHLDTTKELLRVANLGENNPQFGKKLSDARRKEIGDQQRGSKRSAETCANISASLIGDKNPMFGKTGAANPMFGLTGNLSPNFGRVRKDSSNQKQSASMKASWARRKERDQEIDWALAPYTLTD